MTLTNTAASIDGGSELGHCRNPTRATQYHIPGFRGPKTAVRSMSGLVYVYEGPLQCETGTGDVLSGSVEELLISTKDMIPLLS